MAKQPLIGYKNQVSRLFGHCRFDGFVDWVRVHLIGLWCPRLLRGGGFYAISIAENGEKSNRYFVMGYQSKFRIDAHRGLGTDDQRP